MSQSTLLSHMYNIEDDFESVIWYIVVNKILYYYPGMFKGWEPCSDAAYDSFEIGYLDMCAQFELRNEFVHKEYPGYEHLESGMMEVDFTHPFVLEIVAFMKECQK